MISLRSAPRILQHHGVRQFIKFGIVGMSSTVINFTVLYVCLHLFRVRQNESVPLRYLSLTIAFMVSVVNGYYWNRQWTFQARGEKHQTVEFLQFVTITGVGLAITLLISKFLVPQFRNDFHLSIIPATFAAQLCATFCVMFWNFFANRLWTFKS